MTWRSKDEVRKLAASRYRNARYLLLERCQGKVARFARALKQRHSYAAAYISEHPTKRIGDVVARRIEQAFSLSEGWLDKERSQNWDRRLRAATGSAVHPLDGKGIEQAWRNALPENLLSDELPRPESADDVQVTGQVLQHRYIAVAQEVNRLAQLRRSLAQQVTPLLDDALEQWALAQDYIVESPVRLNGPFFRLWHPDPIYSSCLQVRISLMFTPALEFRPLPPSTREVLALPFFAANGKLHFFFIPADERISPFDVADIKEQDGQFILQVAPQAPVRVLDAYLDPGYSFPVPKKS